MRPALIVVIAAILSACAAEKPGAHDDQATACTALGGTWLAEHLECETGEQAWCESQNGTFDPCRSPCRHSPEQICVTLCQPVCNFSK